MEVFTKKANATISFNINQILHRVEFENYDKMLHMLIIENTLKITFYMYSTYVYHLPGNSSYFIRCKTIQPV